MPVTVLVAPGPEDYHANPHPAACTGISVRGMNRTLLVAHQNMPDIGVAHLVIDINRHTAGVTEYRVHSFGFKGGQKNFSTG